MSWDPDNADPWTDGARPHHCGFYVEEHELVYVPTAEGGQVRKWQCPPISSAPVLGG